MEWVITYGCAMRRQWDTRVSVFDRNEGGHGSGIAGYGVDKIDKMRAVIY